MLLQPAIIVLSLFLSRTSRYGIVLCSGGNVFFPHISNRVF